MLFSFQELLLVIVVGVLSMVISRELGGLSAAAVLFWYPAGLSETAKARICEAGWILQADGCACGVNCCHAHG